MIHSEENIAKLEKLKAIYQKTNDKKDSKILEWAIDDLIGCTAAESIKWTKLDIKKELEKRKTFTGQYSSILEFASERLVETMENNIKQAEKDMLTENDWRKK